MRVLNRFGLKFKLPDVFLLSPVKQWRLNLGVLLVLGGWLSLSITPALAQGYPGGGGYPGSGSSPGHWQVTYQGSDDGQDIIDSNNPTPWSTQATYYQPYFTRIGTYKASSIGSIKVQLTWTHEAGQDNTTDPPPATIYVQEKASALAIGYYRTSDGQGNTITHPASLSVDNGFGDTITSDQDDTGVEVSQTMGGTHYRAISNPNRDSVVDLGTHSLGASASWNYASATQGTAQAILYYQVVPITLRILRGGMDITDPRPQPEKVRVGERIQLSAQVTPSDLPDLPINYTNQRWSVPGYHVYDFVAGLSSGSVVPGSTIFDESSVNYCWVDGGNGRVVTYTVTLGGMQMSASATFDVYRPNIPARATPNTEGPKVDTSYEQDQQWYLYYGTPGITFSCDTTQVTGEANEAYELQWVQLASPNRRQKLADGTWQKFTGPGLDRSLDVQNNSSYAYTWGVTQTDDSPGSSLGNNLREKTVNDSFTMWLMYRPVLPGAIWVPMRSISWSWGGHAVAQLAQDGTVTGWTGDSFTFTPPAPTDLADTTAYPSWTWWTGYDQWVNE